MAIEGGMAGMMHEILSNLAPIKVDDDNPDIRTYSITSNEGFVWEITALTHWQGERYNGGTWSYEILSWTTVDPYPCQAPMTCVCC